MSADPQGKHKILFLHGKGENAKTFRARLRRLEDALVEKKGDAVSLEFVTAPHLIGSDDKYAWWNLPPNQRSFTASEYIGMDETFKMIEKTWMEKGPFDAVVGHSQGAILITVLLSRALLRDFSFKPAKAILFGAAWPNPFDGELNQLAAMDLATSSYSPQTLHVYAMNDNINPPEMAKRIEKGHDIPMDDKSLAKFSSFLFD
ncbi:hypothetical protein GUITHDRAFT_147999 [Guillardia theta CCMP2712]|uniref:Serine hydrolase domain-containing protein n=1 Tax=Guillardia theta (strain CCMP2712) TaxID=905079 RepID=L1IAR4_GUITC|nr:hypothetical protein GUITHDRAFT_147999 [Guillardia theta CCMP2712]EKX33331.1 hypothetical protein GUITHDRAFT_147999 [Guillardia theta CCMP2712]|eukprot:XP_005820311.1 hypothetical protein GUITHDRAFT_147999 [Guillardia theta CCMP2712]